MLKIVVLLKFFKGEIGPFDETALECALRVSDADITLLTLSPLQNSEKLAYYTRLGVSRAIMISDAVYAGSDTLATSRILSAAIKRLSPDLVICGRQSINGDTAQVPAEISEMLNYSFIPYAMSFDTGEIETRLGRKKVVTPSVISVERFLKLRIPSFRAIEKKVEIWTNDFLKIPAVACGLAGSPTKVVEAFSNDKSYRECKYFEKRDFETVIQSAIKGSYKAAEIKNCESKLSEVLVYGSELREKAETIAKRVVTIKSKSPDKIAEEIENSGIKNVLFSASLENRVIAPIVAAKLGIGLAADCVNVETDGKELFVYRPAVSSTVIAKIKSESRIKMCTLRCKETDSDKIVFGIGNGAKGRVDEIKALAEKYGAETVATRKLVDDGLFAYDKQVGLTGRIIAPKVYVAFGISGAVQHIVGIENSNSIVSVNCDKHAEIFKYSDFGIVDRL